MYAALQFCFFGNFSSSPSLSASISAYNKSQCCRLFSLFILSIHACVRVCVFVLLLGDRCTTQRDSVTHNKFEDISTKSVRFHFTYFCSLFFCSFNKSFIISRLFFLRLVDWFAFCENLFSLAAVGAAFFPVRCFFLSFFSRSVFISYWRQKDYLLLVAIHQHCLHCLLLFFNFAFEELRTFFHSVWLCIGSFRWTIACAWCLISMRQ